jgi:microcystin-dependent protein
MASPYVGEIRMFAGNFAPAGWAFCQGQLMPISENDTLFQLIGTTYGGDGQETFALPDLQGRVPIHYGTASSGSSYQIGESLGVEQVTLTVNQIPVHNHTVNAAAAAGTQASPAGNFPAASTAVALYNSNAPNVSMYAGSLQSGGGSQPHDNMQPFVCVTFIISLFGIYPSPT